VRTEMSFSVESVRAVSSTMTSTVLAAHLGERYTLFRDGNGPQARDRDHGCDPDYICTCQQPMICLAGRKEVRARDRLVAARIQWAERMQRIDAVFTTERNARAWKSA